MAEGISVVTLTIVVGVQIGQELVTFVTVMYLGVVMGIVTVEVGIDFDSVAVHVLG